MEVIFSDTYIHSFKHFFFFLHNKHMTGIFQLILEFLQHKNALKEDQKNCD